MESSTQTTIPQYCCRCVDADREIDRKRLSDRMLRGTCWFIPISAHAVAVLLLKRLRRAQYEVKIILRIKEIKLNG